MYFLIENNDVLNKYNTIWDKVSSDTKKRFDRESVYIIHDKEIIKVGFNHTCVSVISLDSILKKDKNSYPQVFLKECKYIKKIAIRHITDDLGNCSDSDESDDGITFP